MTGIWWLRSARDVAKHLATCTRQFPIGKNYWNPNVINGTIKNPDPYWGKYFGQELGRNKIQRWVARWYGEKGKTSVDGSLKMCIKHEDTHAPCLWSLKVPCAEKTVQNQVNKMVCSVMSANPFSSHPDVSSMGPATETLAAGVEATDEHNDTDFLSPRRAWTLTLQCHSDF